MLHRSPSRNTKHMLFGAPNGPHLHRFNGHGVALCPDHPDPPQVERRTISCGNSRIVTGGRVGSMMRFSSSSIACLPTSYAGWRTTESGGSSDSAQGRSSKPTTAALLRWCLGSVFRLRLSTSPRTSCGRCSIGCPGISKPTTVGLCQIT